MNWSRGSLLVLAATAAPMSASAHLVSSGLGPVYDGIVHFAFSPEELVVTGVLALLAGRCGNAPARSVMFVFPSAWYLGGWAGIPLSRGWQELAPAAGLLAVGGLLAANARLSRPVLIGMALVLGLIYGGIDAASFVNRVEWAVLVGGAAAIFVLMTLLAAVAVSLRDFRAIIAARVAGSWAAAFGLLLAGWAWHSPR
jgi:urease accessory protein